MASQEADFCERDLSGFKYLDRLLPMLARLHDSAVPAIEPAIANSITINTACWCCSLCSIR
jgi:hypothetical protein